MKLEIHFNQYLVKETQSSNETWSVYVISQKKKLYQLYKKCGLETGPRLFCVVNELSKTSTG